MCGYCIECGVLIPALESAYKGETVKIDGFYIANYLQEEDNFYIAVDKAKEFENFNDFSDIAICRLYEQYILYGLDNALYKKITSIFGHDVVDVFLKKRRALNNKQNVSAIWEKLYDKEIYQNNRQWSNFMSAKTELIEISSNVLSFYYDWWIKGHKKEISDPMERLNETGIMDPIENTPQKEWEKFYALFPWFYFSLMYLWKYHSNTELIKKIALHHPKDVPDFEGYDLWLQRKAFVFYIQKVGITKMLKHVDKIRFELIYYALLKCKVSRDEIKTIIRLLRENQDRLVLDEDAEYYISKIEDVITKFTK